MEHLKYPVGKFTKPENIDKITLEKWIKEIEDFPAALEELTQGLTSEQLQFRYRPGGWTIKQVVHHCADSHMNSIIRFKLALTEDAPTIRPYFEDRWAELPDGLDDNISDSIFIIKGVHGRWIKLLNNLTAEELNRTFIHPEHGKVFTLKENIGIYAWHGRHHLGHIRLALGAG